MSPQSTKEASKHQRGAEGCPPRWSRLCSAEFSEAREHITVTQCPPLQCMPHQTQRQGGKNENLSGHFAFMLENKNQQSTPLLCIGPYSRSFWEPMADSPNVGLQKCTHDVVYTRNIEIFSIQVTSAVSTQRMWQADGESFI